MGLFGALVRTVVNVVALPVTLPIAAVRDTLDVMGGESPREVRRVVKQLKDEASEEE